MRAVSGGHAVLVVIPPGVVRPGTIVPTEVGQNPAGARLDRDQRRLQVRRLPLERGTLARLVGGSDGSILGGLVDGGGDGEAAVLDGPLRLALELGRL